MTANILVIEDDTGFALILTAILRSLGITSKHFTNAEQAMAAWKKDEYTAVIVDILLPGMSGLEFLAMTNPEKAIVMSCQIASDLGSKLCPKYLFVPKPFGPEALYATLLKLKVIEI